MRYFLHLAYKGKNYHGWQRQKSVVTIQQTIEETLSKMLGEDLTIHGCGRTDAGVHASQYFANFNTNKIWEYDPVIRINRMLPDDIAVFDFIAVAHNANTQHDAFRRTYQYFIHFQSEPFLNELSTYYDGSTLDLTIMSKAAEFLKEFKDFRCLCKSPDKVPHTRCNLSHVQILKHQNGQRIRFDLTSNRFLRGMIRLIVAKLLDIGQGKLSLEEWRAFLSQNENKSYKSFAPPQGLHLSKIEYPYLNIATKQEDDSCWEVV